MPRHMAQENTGPFAWWSLYLTRTLRSPPTEAAWERPPGPPSLPCFLCRLAGCLFSVTHESLSVIYLHMTISHTLHGPLNVFDACLPLILLIPCMSRWLSWSWIDYTSVKPNIDNTSVQAYTQDLRYYGVAKLGYHNSICFCHRTEGKCPNRCTSGNRHSWGTNVWTNIGLLLEAVIWPPSGRRPYNRRIVSYPEWILPCECGQMSDTSSLPVSSGVNYWVPSRRNHAIRRMPYIYRGWTQACRQAVVGIVRRLYPSHHSRLA